MIIKWELNYIIENLANGKVCFTSYQIYIKLYVS